MFFALSLLIVKYFLQTQAESFRAQLESNKKNSERIADLETINKINTFNIFFEKLNTFYQKKIYISEAIDKTSKILPNKIYLTEFSASPDLTGSPIKQQAGFNIFITGFAPTREDLLLFKQNMEKDSYFKAVNFPIENWVESVNIIFSLSFKIINPCVYDFFFKKKS